MDIIQALKEELQIGRNQVEAAVKLIANAKRPLLIAGGGVTYSEAEDALLAFAERFSIPIGETQAGKGQLPWDHPLNLGGIGVTGGAAANALAKEADLVIAVGSRLTDFTTASKWGFQHPDVKLLGVQRLRFRRIEDGCANGHRGREGNALRPPPRPGGNGLSGTVGRANPGSEGCIHCGGRPPVCR